MQSEILNSSQYYTAAISTAESCLAVYLRKYSASSVGISVIISVTVIFHMELNGLYEVLLQSSKLHYFKTNIQCMPHLHNCWHDFLVIIYNSTSCNSLISSWTSILQFDLFLKWLHQLHICVWCNKFVFEYFY